MEDIRSETPQMMSVVRFRLTGRGDIHKVLAEKGAADDLLTELQRREAVRAVRKEYAGLVWTEGFSIETGLAVDREHLLLEDSFLGEMLRLAEHSGGNAAELDELVATALRPMMENQELRRLLLSIGAEEKQEWLRGAVELGITLLSGLEESGGTPQNAAEEGKDWSAKGSESFMEGSELVAGRTPKDTDGWVMSKAAAEDAGDGDGQQGREVEE